MNTDAIDKLLEQIDATEQRYSREIIDKLVWARGEIERKNKLIEQAREALAWVNGVSCSFPGFYFENGEDSEGNERESISECVRAALEAINKE